MRMGQMGMGGKSCLWLSVCSVSLHVQFPCLQTLDLLLECFILLIPYLVHLKLAVNNFPMMSVLLSLYKVYFKHVTVHSMQSEKYLVGYSNEITLGRKVCLQRT